MRTEEEVNQMVDEMIARTKGKYITQGVSFNKECPRQIGMLKKALMSSVSFSGLAKEMLALRFDEHYKATPMFGNMGNGMDIGSKPKSKNVGNFL
jgi:hypothetical protein